jgi:hypothetical protein
MLKKKDLLSKGRVLHKLLTRTTHSMLQKSYGKTKQPATCKTPCLKSQMEKQCSCAPAVGLINIQNDCDLHI